MKAVGFYYFKPNPVAKPLPPDTTLFGKYNLRVVLYLITVLFILKITVSYSVFSHLYYSILFSTLVNTHYVFSQVTFVKPCSNGLDITNMVSLVVHLLKLWFFS